MQSIIYQLQNYPNLIKVVSGEKIFLGNAYYQMQLKGTEKDMYIREGVWMQLLKAAELLPTHLGFYLFDTYRSIETQKPSLDEETLMTQTRTFVADPFNLEIRHKLSHPTGAAVDLGLFDLNEKKIIDMGTPFDDPTMESSTHFFKDHTQIPEKIFHQNREILYQSMIQVGFTNYSKEWWHFDLGDYSWANKTNAQWHYDIIEKRF